MLFYTVSKILILILKTVHNRILSQMQSYFVIQTMDDTNSGFVASAKAFYQSEAIRLKIKCWCEWAIISQ